MEIKIWLKGNKEPLVYKGERVEVLDFEMAGESYKQIRCTNKGRSKSELILSNLIKKIG